MQSTTTATERDLMVTFLHLNRADRSKVARMDRYYTAIASRLGLSVSEIAEGLGLSESSVDALLAEIQ